ncbi:MAG: NAD-dependent epimerase/dehydratase family protein [Myxococcaceae bacterium]
MERSLHEGHRVLLTGASGVIGRRALPLLLAAGHRVTAVCRTPEQRELLRALGATPVSMNLLEPPSVRAAVAGHTVVINLATHMPSSALRMLLPWSWRENDRIRREGSAILAEAAIAAGVERLVQESFAPVFEYGGDRWIDEGWPVRPAPYNRTVLDAEASAERFGRSGGAAVILRFAGFYGPDRMLRDLLATVRKGWAPLPGAPGAYWSSVSHEDAASAVLAAVGAPGGVYTVGDDEPVTREAFGEICARAIGASRPRPLPGWLTRLGGKTAELLSRSQRMSNGKLKRASGWAPRWRSVREGIPEAARQLGLVIGSRSAVTSLASTGTRRPRSTPPAS